MRNDFFNHNVINLTGNDFSKLRNDLNDKTLDVRWDFITSNFIEVKKRKLQEEDRALPRDTNIFIGVFTTSYARETLYEGLEKLGRSVLYHDTDSILFVYKDPENIPLILGDFLGNWTDELDGAFITEFYSAGPKNYAFKDSKGNEVIKCKGFNLNKPQVKQKFSLSLFKKAVEAKASNLENVTQTVEFKLEEGGILTRDDIGKIKSQACEKTWQCVYTKREIVYSETSEKDKMIDTLPFGFLN